MAARRRLPKSLRALRRELTVDKLRAVWRALIDAAAGGDVRATKLLAEVMRSPAGEWWGAHEDAPEVTDLDLDVEQVDRLLAMARQGQLRPEHVRDAFEALRLKHGLAEAQQLDEIEARLEELRGRRGALGARWGLN